MLFGDSNDKQRLGDTWELDGSKWKLVATDGPEARSLGAMAYDEQRGRMVLFGGSNAQRQPLGDTWEWDGKQWMRINVAGGPSPRGAHVMVYPAGRRTVILMGGSKEQALSDLWEWDGKSWNQLAQPEVPPRLHFAFGYDSRRACLVVFGGFGAHGRIGDTWEWDGKTWQEFKSPVHLRGLNLTESISPITGSSSSAGLLDRDWPCLKEPALTICGSGTAKTGSVFRPNRAPFRYLLSVKKRPKPPLLQARHLCAWRS